MLSKAQYKRLVYVVSLPLILCGIWLAETEFFGRSGYLILCQEELHSKFLCVDTPYPDSDSMERYEQVGVYFSVRNALLLSGLSNKKIVTTGHAEITFEDGVWGQITGVGAGQEKQLRIPRSIGSYSSGFIPPCSLSLASDNTTWHLSCGGETESFQFAEPSTQQKFLDLWAKLQTDGERMRSLQSLKYAVVVFVPLVIFFLLSLTLLILNRLFAFVRYGKRVP